MTLSEARALVIAMVRDDAGKLTTPDHYDQALTKALSYYSQFRPLKRSQTIPCGADGKILASSITGFDEGFIEQMKIEFPIVTTFGRPNWLDDSYWSFEYEDAGPLIRFIDSVPQDAANVRIVHRTKHVLPADDADDLTVRESDTEAVCDWAAAEALLILASFFTQTTDRAPQADFAGFANKGQDYQARAREHKRAFYHHLNAAGRRENSTVELVRG